MFAGVVNLCERWRDRRAVLSGKEDSCRANKSRQQLGFHLAFHLFHLQPRFSLSSFVFEWTGTSPSLNLRSSSLIFFFLLIALVTACGMGRSYCICLTPRISGCHKRSVPVHLQIVQASAVPNFVPNNDITIALGPHSARNTYSTTFLFNRALDVTALNFYSRSHANGEFFPGILYLLPTCTTIVRVFFV